MPYIYDDTIKWPASKDSFPTLYNQGEVEEVESTVVYAEHYRKVQNFIVKVQNLFSNSRITNDGTVDSLGVKCTLQVPFNDLYRHIVRSNPSSMGGNCFEFDVVIVDTTSGDFSSYLTASPTLRLVFDSSLLGGFGLITDKLSVSLNVTPNSSLSGIPTTLGGSLQPSYNSANWLCSNYVIKSTPYDLITIPCSMISTKYNLLTGTPASWQDLLVNINIIYLK